MVQQLRLFRYAIYAVLTIIHVEIDLTSLFCSIHYLKMLLVSSVIFVIFKSGTYCCLFIDLVLLMVKSLKFLQGSHE